MDCFYAQILDDSASLWPQFAEEFTEIQPSVSTAHLLDCRMAGQKWRMSSDLQVSYDDKSVLKYIVLLTGFLSV